MKNSQQLLAIKLASFVIIGIFVMKKKQRNLRNTEHAAMFNKVSENRILIDEGKKYLLT